jgi:biopolymer transport protein ExbB
MREAYELLKLGGPLMIPIALCSVIALTIFLERLLALQPQRLQPAQFASLLGRALRERRFDRAKSLCEGNDSALARITLHALSHQGRERSIVKEAIEEAGHREIARMEKFVGALGTIASIAPLLGLLGTVTGMLGVFQSVVDEVKNTGEVNPASLAGGIWEALITTAAGLSVAIPAFLMFKFLMSKIDHSVIRLEQHTSSLVDPIAAPDPTARIAAHEDEEDAPASVGSSTAVTAIPAPSRQD